MNIRIIALAFALASPVFGQQLCTLHTDFSMGSATGQVAPAAGNTQVMAIPLDQGRNINICAVYVAVTQGTTAANFQLRGCADATCSVTQVLTPLFTGHASYLDTYSNAASNVVEPVLRGRGVFLYLSSAPTAAHVQVFYSQP